MKVAAWSARCGNGDTALQVLHTASRLAQAKAHPDPGVLATFLGSTAMIRSVDEIDSLMKVLKTRRTALQNDERAIELQLLRLFLENAKCACSHLMH